MVRYQADRLSNTPDLLHQMAGDPHPRVQMEVVDAVAHLRPTLPSVEHALHALNSTNPDVEHMLADLHHGTKPAKGRSVPVLEIASGTRLQHWQWLGMDGSTKPVAFDTQAEATSAPGSGVYRTFLRSDVAQPVTLAVKYSFLDITVNGGQLLSHHSQWSSEQQVQFELARGLNVIEVAFRNLKGLPPAVYLHDPLGQPLAQAHLTADAAALREFASAWEQANTA